MTLTAAAVDNAEALNAKQQAKVGDNPVIELSILVGGQAITEFRGIVTVSVPYTPSAETAEDDYDLLTVYYLDDDGNIQEMQGARYDAATGTITFTTTHFGKFFVAEWISPFNDIAKGEWYYKAARYAYSNGLITGVTPTTFAPQSNLTRAMLVTVLFRSAQEQWSVGSGQWSVDEGAGGLATYTDAGEISGWALDALKWANATGLITGRTATPLRDDAALPAHNALNNAQRR